MSVYLRLVVRVFPLVRRELAEWKRRATGIPDGELRRQALSSIASKAFHCMGGSVLALLNPGRLQELVKAIVAVQTVSDYLDNLCDRASASSAWANDPSMDAARKGFLSCMTVHEAFRCAVDPNRLLAPFYRMYPVAHPGGDGGYLGGLVEASRDVLRKLPLYDTALPWVNHLAGLYSELQSIKHLSPAVRDGLMEEWYRVRWVRDLDSSACSLPLPRRASQGLSGAGKEVSSGKGGSDKTHPAFFRPETVTAAWPAGRLNGGADGRGTGRPLAWWEFAAATGSTLGIFALICASSVYPDAYERPGSLLSSTQPARLLGSYRVRDLFLAYFPSICGLHILLDYYIDREEDRLGGDLNFVGFYPSPQEREAGLLGFVERAMDAASRLPHPWMHLAVVRGLLAMYLSDPKVGSTGLSNEARALATRGGPLVRVLTPACGVIRKVLGF